MSRRARRDVAYTLAVVAVAALSAWDGTHRAWEAVLGADAGRAMAEFWDLQVETWAFAVLVPAVLGGLYRLRWSTAHGWRITPPSRALRLSALLALTVVALVCSAEGPVRELLTPVLGDATGASLAHYLRRGLEGVLSMAILLVFLETVRPGPFAVVASDDRPPGSGAGEAPAPPTDERPAVS